VTAGSPDDSFCGIVLADGVFFPGGDVGFGVEAGERE
jgi:hypothetical protein